MTNEVSKKSLPEQFFNVQLLTDSDLSNLQKSCEFILSTYESVPMFRPLAIKIFGVLNDKDFPTVDLKYNQCKIEAEVHSNELIKELHDIQMQKLHIEKAEYMLNNILKIKRNQAELEKDELKTTEINFDMQEQAIIISRKKFDFKLLEKKIKYRIMEIHEWKEISEALLKAPNFKNKNYNDLMIDLFTNDYSNKLNDNNLSEDKKMFIKQQLEILNNIKLKTQ